LRYEDLSRYRATAIVHVKKQLKGKNVTLRQPKSAKQKEREEREREKEREREREREKERERERKNFESNYAWKVNGGRQHLVGTPRVMQELPRNRRNLPIAF